MQTLPLLVFDVNETLLDLEIMSPIFERIFQEKSAMRAWFADLILYSEALTLAQSYVPFTEIGAAAMEMLAATRGVQITEADKRGLTDQFSTMPPHPEVPSAIDRLRQVGELLEEKCDEAHFRAEACEILTQARSRPLTRRAIAERLLQLPGNAWDAGSLYEDAGSADH